jgi:hypothetical protein
MATEIKKKRTQAPREEQRKAAAERMAKVRAAKQEPAKVEVSAETKSEPSTSATYTESDVQRMIEMALAKQAETLQRPQVIQVEANVEKVLFMWQAEVADDNIVTFGDGGMFGRITGKTGSFYIPKTEFSRIMDERTRWMIDQRWLIVLDGLDESEREALNCNYKPGEILDKGAFAKLVEQGDKMLEIFPKLCASHRMMVAQRYLEAYENGSPYVTRERVLKLNEISKKEFADVDDKNPLKRGAFAGIIDKMNAKDAQ